MSAKFREPSSTSQQQDNPSLATPRALVVGADINILSEKHIGADRTTSPVTIEHDFDNKFTTRRLIVVLATSLACFLLGLKYNCWLFGPETSREHARTTFGTGKKLSTPLSHTKYTDLLDVFQVRQPVFAPPVTARTTRLGDGEGGIEMYGTGVPSPCEVVLMEHSFGFSYGKPFIGSYTPPKCLFNRVIMNFTVTSKGRQFDRLAIMYFNDTEIWRTSTAEPTFNGIRWEYQKDMSAFIYFWNSPQKIIFDLGNLIDDTYTGAFNTTLTARFLYVNQTDDPASLIIPISARKGADNAASVYMLPKDNATNTVKFPRNVNRAIFSISACGQAAEEFWWSNVLQSNTQTFEDETGILPGYSPFREVQVLVDGQIAGVQWPFPVIFTGGVSPGLWRPIVGIDAFDLREHEIDLSPWLPRLCDGNEHSFEIRVVGIQDDGEVSGTLTKSVGYSWYVTGKIFVWLDEDSSAVTTGRDPTILLPEPVISLSQIITQNKSGSNQTLKYAVDVKRTLSISSLLTTQHESRLVTWTQNLAFTNYGYFTSLGSVQESKQHTSGMDQSTGGTYYKSSYMYPLYANTSFIVDQTSGNFSIGAQLELGLSLHFQGIPVHPTHVTRSARRHGDFPSTSLSTTQNGSACYFASPKARWSTGFGSTSQVFSFKGGHVGAEEELYFRNVKAINSTVIRDHEDLDGVPRETNSPEARPIAEFAVSNGRVLLRSPKEMLGRGPGKVKSAFVQGRQDL